MGTSKTNKIMKFVKFIKFVFVVLNFHSQRGARGVFSGSFQLDQTDNAIVSQYRTDLDSWSVKLDDTYNANCILPQIAKHSMIRLEQSTFMVCSELSSVIISSEFLLPNRIPFANASCLGFLKTMTDISFVESQAICGDPYLDNAVVVTSDGLLISRQSDTIRNIFRNDSQARLDFRVLFIRKMMNNYAVHQKIFNLELRIPSTVANLDGGHFIVENFCAHVGLRTIPHSILRKFLYHESLYSCLVECHHNFIRTPWNSRPSFQNISQNDQFEAYSICLPVSDEFTASLFDLTIVTSTQMSVAWTASDDFFGNLRSLELIIQNFTNMHDINSNVFLKLPLSRYDDKSFGNLVNAIIAMRNSDAINFYKTQIVQSKPLFTSRRLLSSVVDESNTEASSVHALITLRGLMLTRNVQKSPSTISRLLHNLPVEISYSDGLITSVEQAHVDRIYRVAKQDPPSQESRIERYLVIGISLGVICIILIIASILTQQIREKKLIK